MAESPIDPILYAWRDWRRDKWFIKKLLYRSWLGQLVHRRHIEIEGDRHQTEQYDDDYMILVDTEVRNLPGPLHMVVIEHYCGPLHWTVSQKAHRLGLSRSWYYERLKDAQAKLEVKCCN